MSFKMSRAVALMLALVLIVGFAGTATAQTDNPYVATFQLKLPTADGAYKGIDPTGAKITWWHNHTGVREQFVKTAVDKFNKDNPWKITVEPIAKSANYADIYQAVLAAMQTNEVPQLTVAYQNQAATYEASKRGTLIDINNFVNDSVLGFGQDWKTQFFQGFLTADVNPQLGDMRTGMPVYRSMEVLYYNVDALTKLGYKAPPKSWAEFKEMACKYVKDGLGTDGYQVRTDASFVAAATFAAGANFYDAKKDAIDYTIPEAKVMPQAMQDMVKEGCAKLIAEANGDQNSFANQAALFYTGSSSGIPYVVQAITKSGKSFNWDIAGIPGYKDQPIQDVYGASISIPKTTPAQELAAWLFLRWYVEPDQQAFWAQNSGYFPVRQDTAAGLADFFKSNKPYESAFKLLTSTATEPGIAGYDPVRKLVTKALNNVLDGKSVDDEFAALTDAANKVLDENRPK
jgi:multiple sugar transport system substrate-binding protein/sn-glycerol 3-phosphate transport system substrate-binding protein